MQTGQPTESNGPEQPNAPILEKPRDPSRSNQAQDDDYGGDLTDVYAASAVFLVTLCVVGVYFFLVRQSGQVPGLLLTGAVSGLAGWGVGILATPYNKSEATRLGDMAALGYAALTGYLVAKLDKLFDALFVKADGRTFDPAIFPYVGVGLSLFLVALIVTYVTRSYKWSVREEG